VVKLTKQNCIVLWSVPWKRNHVLASCSVAATQVDIASKMCTVQIRNNGRYKHTVETRKIMVWRFWRMMSMTTLQGLCSLSLSK